MIRRRSVVLLAAPLAVALAGCSTFSDNDAAARVADEELSHDDLESLTDGQVGPEVPQADEVVRAVLRDWLITRILEEDVAHAGGSVSADDVAAQKQTLSTSYTGWDQFSPAYQDLLAEQNAAFTVWSDLAPTPSDDDLRASYDEGLDRSGIACIAVILTEDRATADDAAAALEAGTDFAEVAATYSTAPGAADDGGEIPCQGADQLAGVVPAELYSALAEAPVGEPVGPVETQFGWFVAVQQPYDEVADQDLATIWTAPISRFTRAAHDIEHEVDPRIGRFDVATRQVLALG